MHWSKINFEGLWRSSPAFCRERRLQKLLSKNLYMFQIKKWLSQNNSPLVHSITIRNCGSRNFRRFIWKTTRKLQFDHHNRFLLSTNFNCTPLHGCHFPWHFLHSDHVRVKNPAIKRNDRNRGIFSYKIYSRLSTEQGRVVSIWCHRDEITKKDDNIE